MIFLKVNYINLAPKHLRDGSIPSFNSSILYNNSVESLNNQKKALRMYSKDSLIN